MQIFHFDFKHFLVFFYVAYNSTFNDSCERVIFYTENRNEFRLRFTCFIFMLIPFFNLKLIYASTQKHDHKHKIECIAFGLHFKVISLLGRKVSKFFFITLWILPFMEKFLVYSIFHNIIRIQLYLQYVRVCTVTYLYVCTF